MIGGNQGNSLDFIALPAITKKSCFKHTQKV